MTTLVYERALARFAAARLGAAVRGPGHGAAHGPLRLMELDPPALPSPTWARVRPHLAGICGSDLATVDGASSRYFEDIVSFPFVPGHEIVGTVEEVPAEAAPVPGTAPGSAYRWSVGDRVVVEPVLGCIPRAVEPPCPACVAGRTGSCQHVAYGHLAPGLQIGYCADTGGGWSTSGLVAHASQLHPVPDSFSDEAAVMVEPTACAVHGALAAGVDTTSTVAVIGAGTLGLATVAALRQLGNPATLVVGAKYAHQQALAGDLGADLVVAPDQLSRAVRRSTRSLRIAGRRRSDEAGPGQPGGGYGTGGADVVVDCVGSDDSIQSALAMVRPNGRVVLVGMPGKVHVDLAGLWHRQVSLVGAYAYGTETVGDQTRRTFDIAFDVVAAGRLERLVSASYPLERFHEALSHAGSAGRRGAVKIVFDLRTRPLRPEAAAPGVRTGTLPPLRKGHSR